MELQVIVFFAMVSHVMSCGFDACQRFSGALTSTSNQNQMTADSSSDRGALALEYAYDSCMKWHKKECDDPNALAHFYGVYQNWVTMLEKLCKDKKVSARQYYNTKKSTYPPNFGNTPTDNC